MGQQVVTANRLDDGWVVFMDENGDWVENVARAAVAEKADADALLAKADTKAQAALVVGPYLIDVAEGPDGTIAPTRNREIIRTLGPTCHTDHGYQAQKA